MIMMGVATKKCTHSCGKYIIMNDAMCLCLVEGASEGCRPKLPHWPFSVSAAPALRVE